jgi:rhodanese-related sulfurtransferase
MKKMTAFSKIIVLLFCFSLTNCNDSTAQQPATQTAPQTAQSVLSPDDFEAKALQVGVQLVDVRTPAEYQTGHIANATNINFNDPSFKANMEKMDKSKPIAVYCAAGGRSGKSAALLTQMGFKTVYDLQGGMGAWRAKGKKVN